MSEMPERRAQHQLVSLTSLYISPASWNLMNAAVTERARGSSIVKTCEEEGGEERGAVITHGNLKRGIKATERSEVLEELVSGRVGGWAVGE